jgi:hypothetical protein
LKAGSATGTWRYEVAYLDQQVSHTFQVPEPRARAGAMFALVALAIARRLKRA